MRPAPMPSVLTPRLECHSTATSASGNKSQDFQRITGKSDRLQTFAMVAARRLTKSARLLISEPYLILCKGDSTKAIEKSEMRTLVRLKRRCEKLEVTTPRDNTHARARNAFGVVPGSCSWDSSDKPNRP